MGIAFGLPAKQLALGRSFIPFRMPSAKAGEAVAPRT
jgi:hypothetical protein